MAVSNPPISAPGYRVSYGPARAPYRGFYINLDRSVERRAALEAQLASLKILDRYARFPAISSADVTSKSPLLKPEQTACFWSHYRALLQAKGSPACVHILEDDAVLSRYLPQVIETEDQNGSLAKFDLVFTE